VPALIANEHPDNDADVIVAIVPIDRSHCWRSAGAA